MNGFMEAPSASSARMASEVINAGEKILPNPTQAELALGAPSPAELALGAPSPAGRALGAPSRGAAGHGGW